jgi:hypothetical protein
MSTITIRYALAPDAAPAGHLLYGWQPEFLIIGNLYPYWPATASEPAHGGDVEITETMLMSPVNHWPDPPGLSILRLVKLVRYSVAFDQLLETDMALRHSIEELLIEAAGERETGQRDCA